MPAAITYSATPLVQNGRLTGVEIETRFPADADGMTELRLPSRDRGHQRLYEALKDLSVEGATKVSAPAPETRIIVSAPGTLITVRYRIDANLAAGQAQTAARAGLPAIGPDSVYLVGRTVFSEVIGQAGAKVRFRWRGARGWRFASDLERLPVDAVWQDVAMSVMMAAPDLRVTRLHLPNTRLRVATLGRYSFAPDEFNAAVSKVIATEQAFWDDESPDFLVALAPLQDPTGDTLEGQGLGDAFTLLATPAIGMRQMVGVLAHEHFHTWNPFQLGGPEAGGAWFAEGFTDYYARKLALRAGVITLDDFVSSWNAALAEYAASPRRNVSNSVLATDRFKDPDLEALAYTRGSIFAALVQARLAAEDRSLDAVMREMRDRSRTGATLAPLNARERLVLLAPRLDEESLRFIRAGETILLPPSAFGACLTVKTQEVAAFDLGFDLESSAANGWVLAGVRSESAAHRAGLRDGMRRIERLTGEPNRSDIPITYRVHDGAAERTITYLPQGTGRLTRQQVEVAPGLDPAARTACAEAVVR